MFITLVSVNLPSGITHLGDKAFENCYALTSINFPDNLANIGNYTFTNCFHLTSVAFPKGLTSIGSYTFYGCLSLTKMSFQGNAPSAGTCWVIGCNNNLTVYYLEGIIGFTTPTWNGLPALSFQAVGQVVGTVNFHISVTLFRPA